MPTICSLGLIFLSLRLHPTQSHSCPLQTDSWLLASYFISYFSVSAADDPLFFPALVELTDHFKTAVFPCSCRLNGPFHSLVSLALVDLMDHFNAVVFPCSCRLNGPFNSLVSLALVDLMDLFNAVVFPCSCRLNGPI